MSLLNRRTAPLLVALLTGVVMPSLAMSQNAPAAHAPNCSAEGINFRADPVFTRNAYMGVQGSNVRREVLCTVSAVTDLKAGDTTFRLTLGRLNYETRDGIQLPVRMVDIARVEGDNAKSLARVLLDDDPLNRESLFEPQIRQVEGAILIRITPRHDRLVVVQGDKVNAIDPFGWRNEAITILPDDMREGANLSIDLEKMEGLVAIRRAGMDPAGKLPGAFDGNRMLAVKLAWVGDNWKVESTAIRRRVTGDITALDNLEVEEIEALTREGQLPEGSEACSISGWSNDKDPKGLNVRAAPDPKAKVLGIVPPPRKAPKSEEAFGPEPIKSEFEIIGYKDGWFLIEKISAPGVAYEVPYPKSAPQPFKGRGWVNARMVGGALAYGSVPSGRFYPAPNADSIPNVIKDSEGEKLSVGTPVKLLACSGVWGLVQLETGQRGWWRSICSNQVTNCS